MINKDRKVWFTANDADTRVSVFSTSGVLQTQFKIVGYRVADMVTDTSGHVFMIIEGGPSYGFGILRFGTGFVPDFQKWIMASNNQTTVELGIDQRLHVKTATATYILDADGNLLKAIQNQTANLSTYQDHGIATVSFLDDTLRVARRDSNMSLIWAKKFRLGLFPSTVYTVDVAHVVAMPGSDDLAVVASIYGNTGSLCNGGNEYEFYTVLLDANGNLKGIESFTSGRRHLIARSSPFGDPLILHQNSACFGPVTEWDMRFQVRPMYNLRPNCGGYATTVVTVPDLPSSGPSLTSLPAVSNLAVNIQPDVFTLQFSSNPAFGVAGSIACVKPCLDVTSQAQGGGLVSFSDDVYGFYTLQYDFGDGTFGSSPDPMHQYPGTGSYLVTVIATNACGADTFSLPVNACVQAQIAGPGSSCGTGTVVFHESSGLPQDSLTWLVNGVAAIGGDTLQFSPPALGTYQISLVYQDGNCRDTNTISFSANTGLPVAAFTYSMVPTRTVNCSNLSTNGVSYAWTLGDGSTSTLANPSHSYFSNGPFQICLTATNACGSVQTCQTMACPFPTANFTISPNGNNVSLTNTSTGATTLFWDFGDGQTATGPVSNHVYASGGTFNICLTASNACATSTLCRSVTIVVNSAANYFRIGYAAIGNAMTPKAVATKNSKSLVVGTAGTTNFMLLVDSLGTRLWSQTMSANYSLLDATAMPNGNFLVVGLTNLFGPASTNGLWMEVTAAGTIQNAKVLGSAGAEQLDGVKAARYGGYLVTGYTSGNTGFYAKLNGNLQVQWQKSVATIPIAGFQAPDSSFWLVEMLQSGCNTLRFVHLDQNGNDLDEYTTLLTTATASPSVNVHNLDAEMACDGTIYVSSSFTELSPIRKKLLVTKFNTMSHLGLTVNYRLAGTSLGGAPYYDAIPTKLLLKGNDTLRIMGSMNLEGASSTLPREDLFVADINPGTLAVYALRAYGANGIDAYKAACVLESGAQMAAHTEGNGELKLHKFAHPSQVQAVASSYTPFTSLFFTTSTFTHNTTATYPSTNFGTTATATPTATAITANGLVLAQMPCTSAVSASFTYSLSGNVLTLNSTSTPGANLQWSIPGASCLTATTVTTTIPCGTPVTVSLRAYDDCRASSASQTITVPGTSISLGPDQTVCPAASAVFTPGPGFQSYAWSNGATTSSVSVSVSGAYSVTVTFPNGCFSSDTIQLSNFPAPVVSIGGNQTVCSGNFATFNATPGFTSYLWSNGATTPSITVSATGSYSVTATNANGCTATASGSLFNFPVVSLSAGSNQTRCPGVSATFTASSGFVSYLWSNGATTSSITVTTPGTYSVTGINANGCSATASVTLSNWPNSTVAIGPNQTVCVGANASFTATPGFLLYQWSNGATSNLITVTTPGPYSVTVTDANGCAATASATLSNFALPTVSIGSNQTVCAGANATFSASSGFTAYQWSNGATTSSVSVGVSGAYSVTATDANGCTATASATLSYFPVTSFTLGPDTTFCPDTTWALAGPNGGTYNWSTGATTQTIAVATAGSYWLQFTSANGCSSHDTIVLTLSTDCVWPGDANHDGVADNQDLLAVGYGFGYSGPLRAGASPLWYGQPAPNWATALPSLVNHKHPDCDGNGTIDYADTTLIAANYGLTHSKNTGVTAGTPLYIVPELDSFPAGDTVFFTIHWGDGSNPVPLAHGLAFSFSIDPQNIATGSLYGRYPNSFLGNGIPDLLTLTYPETGSGNWHIALSRKDRVGRAGAGAVMRVGFLPDVVYPLTSTLGYVPVRLLNPFAVDADFNAMLISAMDDSILIYNPVNAQVQPSPLTACDLHPVPTAGRAMLDLQLSEIAEVEVNLIDMHGRRLQPLMRATTLNLGRHQIKIDTDDLSAGMYFVQVVVDRRVMVKKLVVER